MSILNLDAVQGKEQPESVPDQEETKLDADLDNIPGDSSKEEGNKVVVMDGPLSRVYTEALNLAYAKEAASASGQTDIKILFDEDIEAQDEENRKALYVYCCDGEQLDMSDTVQATDKLRLALDSGKYKKVLMAMEASKGISNSAGLLDEYARRNGVQVLFKRSTALESIKA